MEILHTTNEEPFVIGDRPLCRLGEPFDEARRHGYPFLPGGTCAYHD
ncbi:hypothetical protein BSFG_04865 [Bacteroides sp. 4_3_47FAA]|nr:hypothetical protein BSFG_04865 [Bacteroides sp. 4_3_47FAA]